MVYGKIITADGSEVLYEIEGPTAGRVAKSAKADLTSSLEERMEDIMALVKDTAENAHLGLQKIEEKARPSEYTIKFGLKLGLGANLIFANGSSEATFELTLKWTRPDEQPRE